VNRCSGKEIKEKEMEGIRKKAIIQVQDVQNVGPKWNLSAKRFD